MTSSVQNRWREWNRPAPATASGWALETVTGPSALYGANGMAFGPDGRLYVAQAFANRVSAIDADGKVETVIPIGSPITGPDDVAFDSTGRMYITDFLGGTVWVREPDGELRLLEDDMPAANGLTVYRDRVFVNEWREGGRLFEVFPDGRPARLIAADLPHPNAMQVGADEKIYFPAVLAGEIHRIALDGSGHETVLDGLALPTAVKFDRNGVLHTTCFASGEVIAYDLKSEQRTVRAAVAPGLDNLAFGPDDELHVSSTITGAVSVIDGEGSERFIVPPGLVWPTDVAVRNGEVLAIDGMSIIAIDDHGQRHPRGATLGSGYPGIVRAAADAGERGLAVTCTHGDVVLYDAASATATTIASGLVQPMGIAVHGEHAYVAESGTGRVHRFGLDGEASVVADGLDVPTGVAVSDDGALFVADAGRGQLVVIEAGTCSVIAEGFGTPMGVAVDDDTVFVLDVASGRLLQVARGGGAPVVIAEGLPVGAPHEHSRVELRGTGMPMTNLDGAFVGITVDALAGLLYLAGIGEGSVLALRQTDAASEASARA